MKIRPYTEDDYTYTHDLHRENMLHYMEKYCGGWNSKIFRRDVSPQTTWIVEYDGHKAGFFILNFEQKAHLRNIQIRSSYQNKGLGTQVLRHCERECVMREFDVLYLEVFLDNPARSLYKRLGYQTYRITHSHYMMKKRLQGFTNQDNVIRQNVIEKKDMK